MTNNINYFPEIVGHKKQQQKAIILARRNEIIRAEVSPSPHFNFSNSTISASGQQLFDLSIPQNATSFYGVFTNLVINNASGSAIYLCMGQQTQNKIYIPSGVIKSLSASDMGGGYTSFILIDATGSGITANTIFIDCYKEGATTEGTLQNAIVGFKRLTNAQFNTIGGYSL